MRSVQKQNESKMFKRIEESSLMQKGKYNMNSVVKEVC